MTLRPTLSWPVVGALAALAASAPRAALAQGPRPNVPTAMAEAQTEFNAALRSLEASPEADCPALCRALSSLARATERLCNLTRGEPEATERRCTDARAKLKEATQRVRGACPDCALAGQAPPTVSVDPGEGHPAEPASPPPTAAPSSAERTNAAERPGARVTLGVGLLRLGAPPALGKIYGEIAPFERFSTLVALGLGELPLTSGGRAGVFTAELQPRAYVLGGAGRGGAFVGASASFSSALRAGALKRAGVNAFDTPLLAAGLSVGPVAGAKLVLGPGLTLEVHGGAGFVVGGRPAGGTRVAPLGDLSVGWTF